MTGTLQVFVALFRWLALYSIFSGFYAVGAILIQATFFFGYMGVISYAFALILGVVSHFVAHKFVRHIYASLKLD